MTALTNNERKRIRSLGSKKFRDELGMFVIEGEKMLEEALKSDFQVLKVYRKDEIGEEAMSSISSLASASPVLAIVKSGSVDLKSEIKNGLYLALDSIRDPGNLGTILRIADWFGIDGVVASPDTVEIYNPKVIQATMGAIFRVKFAYSDIAAFSSDVLKSGGKVYGTFLDGENIYRKEIATGRDECSVIVIGNESKGISEAVSKLVSDRLYIPPFPMDNPGSESLNAAIATAITVAEFRRRALGL